MTLTTTPLAPHSGHFMTNFKLHSVLLVGTLACALAITGHTQTVAGQSQNSPASQIQSPAPAAGGNGSMPGKKVTSAQIDAAFNRADTNGDGKLDRREAELFPAVAERFEQIDTNHDSFISREELRQMSGS